MKRVGYDGSGHMRLNIGVDQALKKPCNIALTRNAAMREVKENSTVLDCAAARWMN